MEWWDVVIATYAATSLFIFALSMWPDWRFWEYRLDNRARLMVTMLYIAIGWTAMEVVKALGWYP